MDTLLLLKGEALLRETVDILPRRTLTGVWRRTGVRCRVWWRQQQRQQRSSLLLRRDDVFLLMEETMRADTLLRTKGASLPRENIRRADVFEEWKSRNMSPTAGTCLLEEEMRTVAARMCRSPCAAARSSLDRSEREGECVCERERENFFAEM